MTCPAPIAHLVAHLLTHDTAHATAAAAAVQMANAQGHEWPGLVAEEFTRHGSDVSDIGGLMAELRQAAARPENAQTFATPGGCGPSLAHRTVTGRMGWDVSVTPYGVRAWIRAFRPVPWAVSGTDAGACVVSVELIYDEGRFQHPRGWRVATVDDTPGMVHQRHVDALLAPLAALVGADEAARVLWLVDRLAD